MIDYDSGNYLGTLLRVRGTVLRGVSGRTLVAMGIGALAAWLHQEYGLKIPALIHTLLGLALGLLLVFRTNASYDRYWEGRKLLGAMVNRSRDLARQIAAFVTGDDDAARAERAELRRHVSALHALIRQSLRRERDLSALGPLLTASERRGLEPIASRPAVLATWLTRRLVRAVEQGRLAEHRLQQMDGSISGIIDAWGGAERILKTPLPFAYAHHIKIFLMLFCFTAPFALVDSMRWYAPLASGIIAFGLFGIEEIGVEIEDPFGHDPNDLPLDRIGETVEKDTSQILADRDGADRQAVA